MSMIRSAFPVARVAYASRTFATTTVARKSLTDTVKETADTVNKKVGQTLASGLGAAQETAQTAQEKVSEATPSKGDMNKAAQSAQETAESARQNTNQALGAAAGKARDAKDDVNEKLAKGTGGP